MNSTLLSPPPPPVNPCNGNPPVVQIMPSESQSKWNSIRSCHQPRTDARKSRHFEAEERATIVYRSGKGKAVSRNRGREVEESLFDCSYGLGERNIPRTDGKGRDITFLRNS